MYKKILIVIMTSTLVLLSACTSNLDVGTGDIPGEQEKSQIKEVYYQFVKGEEDRVALQFPFNIEKHNVVKVELYQEDELMSKDVTVISNNKNILQIMMKSYIPKFNVINLILKNGNALRLNIGQYYFEGWSHPINDLQQDEKGHVRYHNAKEFKEDKNITWSSKGQFDNIENSVIKVVIPEILREELKINQVEVIVEKEGESDLYRYEVNIPTKYLLDNNLEKITFDAIWIQEVLNTGEKQFLLKEQVTITVP